MVQTMVERKKMVPKIVPKMVLTMVPTMVGKKKTGWSWVYLKAFESVLFC